MSATKILNFSFMLFVLFGCKESTELPSGYWIDSSNNIIMISSNESFYELCHDRITSKKESEFELTDITDKGFSLLTHGESIQFRQAVKNDFLNGEWKCMLNEFPENLMIGRDRNYEWKAFRQEPNGNVDFEYGKEVNFNVLDSNTLQFESDTFFFDFSQDKKTLNLTNTSSKEKNALSRGHWSDEETEQFTKDAFTKYANNSGANKNWSKVLPKTTEKNFEYSNEMLLYKGTPILWKVISDVFVSPISHNGDFVSVYAEEKLHFINLRNQEKTELEIYSPQLWMSWSPDCKYAVFFHYFEAGDGTLYSLNTETMKLEDLSFGKTGGYEDFELKKLVWTSNHSFELPGTVNCDPYIEGACDGVNEDGIISHNLFKANLESQQNSVEAL